MAVMAVIKTTFGEDRECYIRLNNVEVSNHGQKATALFRGFISEDAYKSGAGFVWERDVEFDADVTKPIWTQAYAAFEKTQD